MAEKTEAATKAEPMTCAEFCLTYNRLAPTMTNRQIREEMGMTEGNFNSRVRQYRKGLEGTGMELKKPVAAKKGGRKKIDYAEIAAALKAQEAALEAGD